MNQGTPIENLSYDAKRALLEAGEQMHPELILEAPGDTVSENTKTGLEIKMAPKSKPDFKIGLTEGYNHQDILMRDGVTRMFMEMEQPNTMGENKLGKLKHQIGVINATGALAELTGFRKTETSEQNPAVDFNKFARKGFEPLESNIPEQALKSVPETTPAPIIITPESVQETPVENFLPDPATLMNEVREMDILVKVLKEDLEK